MIINALIGLLNIYSQEAANMPWPPNDHIVCPPEITAKLELMPKYKIYLPFTRLNAGCGNEWLEENMFNSPVGITSDGRVLSEEYANLSGEEIAAWQNYSNGDSTIQQAIKNGDINVKLITEESPSIPGLK